MRRRKREKEKRKRKEEGEGRGKKKKIWCTDGQGSAENTTLSRKLSYNHGINLIKLVALFRHLPAINTQTHS